MIFRKKKVRDLTANKSAQKIINKNKKIRRKITRKVNKLIRHRGRTKEVMLIQSEGLQLYTFTK